MEKEGLCVLHTTPCWFPVSIRTQGGSGRVLVGAEGDEQDLVRGGDGSVAAGLRHVAGQDLPRRRDVRRLVVGGVIVRRYRFRQPGLTPYRAHAHERY